MGKLVRVVNHRDARVVISCERRGKPAKEGESGALTIDELVLESGANNVDSDRIEDFCKEGSPSALMFEHGVLDVQDLPEPKQDAPAKGSIDDLSKLKEAEALKVVASCKSKPQLSKYIKQDGRKGVREALIKRYEELTKAEGDEQKED